MSKTTEFDPASYLDSEEVIAEYLNLALASGDTDLLLSAIGDVAKARGMAQIAKATGLGVVKASKSPWARVPNHALTPLSKFYRL
jgi:probable addiction module antidote protein